jgi:outer membrane protein assembly factor BamB
VASLILLATVPAVALAGTAADIADVPMHRADAARTGAMPGPGPAGVPIIRWRADIADAIYSSAAVVAGIAYVCTDNNQVVAVDVRSGDVRWRSDEAGLYSSPAVAGGLVYAGDVDGSSKPGGRLAALDAATGALRWAFETNGDVYGSPVVAGDAVYVEDDTGILYALDTASGGERWQAQIASEAGGDPAVAGDTVYIGALDTGDLLALDAATGAERWRLDLGDGTLSTPSVAGGTVYTTGARLLDEDTAEGVLVAADAATGADRWRVELDAWSSSSPAVVDGTVYVGDVSGQLYAFDAETGAERWRTRVGPYVSFSSPGVADGVVYVMSAGTVVALDAATGTVRWLFEIRPGNDDVDSSPVVTGGLVIAGGGDGALYALGGARSGTPTVSTATTEALGAIPTRHAIRFARSRNDRLTSRATTPGLSEEDRDGHAGHPRPVGGRAAARRSLHGRGAGGAAEHGPLLDP